MVSRLVPTRNPLIPKRQHMEFGRTKNHVVKYSPHLDSSSGASTMAAPSADLVQALMGFPASAGKPVTRATAPSAWQPFLHV